MEQPKPESKRENIEGADLPLQDITELTLNVGIHYLAYKKVEYDPKVGTLRFTATRAYRAQSTDLFSDEMGMRETADARENRWEETSHEEASINQEKIEERMRKSEFKFDKSERNDSYDDITEYSVDIGKNLSARQVADAYRKCEAGWGELISFQKIAE